MTNVIEILRARGFIDNISSEGLQQIFEKPCKVYCGFDPTAPSLHLGNLVGIMALAWFQRYGHTPVAVVGGATGMVGDPSGKSQERNLLDEAQIAENLVGIRQNIEQVLQQGKINPLVLNNFEWFRSFSFLSFLRDIGKFFRMGPMLAKESVKARLLAEEGMSFTEFCYQTLQGYDFLYLYENHGVTLQIGGSDQWGNITAGIDLIRKVKGEEAYGLTFPLLVKADGQKFGKSEQGAIWLSKERLSPFAFYQHLIRTDDRDVITLLKRLTFLELEEIERLEEEMKAPGYVANTAQRILAAEVTRIVHGQEGLEAALKATEAARPGHLAALDLEALEAMLLDVPHKEVRREQAVGVKMIDLIAQLAILPSKGEARRLMQNGGLFLNNEKVSDEGRLIVEKDLVGGRFLLISTGKKNKTVVSIQK